MIRWLLLPPLRAYVGWWVRAMKGPPARHCMHRRPGPWLRVHGASLWLDGSERRQLCWRHRLRKAAGL